MRAFQEPSDWRHHSLWVEEDVKIHYVEALPAAPNGRTLVLIHGYPETWYAFRFAIGPLSDLGYRVIAVDYRGAGESNKPLNGYDKETMARDIHTLYRDKLGIESAIICGYDIGSMIAVSLALRYREHVKALISFEAPTPGSRAFETMITDPQMTFGRVFHYFFHQAMDLPEFLVQGKEREYIMHFYNRLSYNPAFLSKADIDVYSASFSQVGAMRAGFNVYRAYLQDAKQLKARLSESGKLQIPVLAMAGEHSLFANFMKSMTEEYAEHVEFTQVSRANHWLPEENPEEFLSVVTDFLKRRLP